MSTAPRGMSIQEGYRFYRDNVLFVNRRYQRKLVWTESEKARLIESVLSGFPVPLILLAEQPRSGGEIGYEIIDGVQRLNAIFSFIENAFPMKGLYFNTGEFARAKQLAENGAFSLADPGQPRLSREDCANLLDYQLAVTIYKPSNDGEVTEVFGRINSGGRQLSDQEKRQAGLVTPFATLVRQLSAEIRGDASRDVLTLVEMPEISIDSKRARQNYGLTAEDTFWCKLGIINNHDLRNSEDEEIVADLAASILLNEPIALSRELLDEIYTSGSPTQKMLEEKLTLHTDDRLRREIKGTLSVLRETIEAYSKEKNALRSLVNPGSGGNPIKAAFYSIFMAFFELTVKQQQSPCDPVAILQGLRNLQQQLVRSAHHALTKDRRQNIDKTIGLIQRYFVRRDPPAFSHGPGLALDLENALRRSIIETARYECKQGLLRLSGRREYDEDLLNRLPEIVCGIANVGPDSNGYLYIGVADKAADAERIRQLDGVTAEKVGQRFVVGIERECKLLGATPEAYVRRIVERIRSSGLSEPLKSQVLSHIDVIEYRGRSVVRLVVLKQKGVSFVGEDAFTREDSNTVEVRGPRLLAVQATFKRA